MRNHCGSAGTDEAVEDKGVRVDCELAPGLPDWVAGDEGRLRQLTINLISNAVKVPSKGGSELGDYYVPGSGSVNNLVLTGVLDVDARAAMTADWSPASGLVAGVTAGWARVTALNHVAGADVSGAYGETRLTLRW